MATATGRQGALRRRGVEAQDDAAHVQLPDSLPDRRP
jgi:hypothetical protein